MSSRKYQKKKSVDVKGRIRTEQGSDQSSLAPGHTGTLEFMYHSA